MPAHQLAEPAPGDEPLPPLPPLPLLLLRWRLGRSSWEAMAPAEPRRVGSTHRFRCGHAEQARTCKL